jgi:GNAT superfamily N-acetyltransferase
MDIEPADSIEQIRRCYAVMRELRPHLAESEFVDRVRRQQAHGYRLVCMTETGEPVAVAGFRLLENLAWGRFLYVDDLVTRADRRSEGHGRTLLAWLHDLARREGCQELHLDSGVQRVDAHRFYAREGMDMTSYHYRTRLA